MSTARRSPLAVAVAVGRIAVAFALAGGAGIFLVRGRAAFAHLGFPDWVRIALAVAEIGAALLFAMPATSRAGAIALLVVLAWAAGFHYALGHGAVPLLLWMAVVALLFVLDVRLGRPLTADSRRLGATDAG